MRQTQLSVDERMAALLRVVDTDVESSGKHIDKCRQIDPRAVDAAYGSGELQSRSELHDIRRRELLGEEQWRLRDFDRHRIGDGRIAKPEVDQLYLKIRKHDGRFEQRRLQYLRSVGPILQPTQMAFGARQKVQQFEGRFVELLLQTVQSVDIFFIRGIERLAFRIRQPSVERGREQLDKQAFFEFRCSLCHNIIFEISEVKMAIFPMPIYIRRQLRSHKKSPKIVYSFSSSFRVWNITSVNFVRSFLRSRTRRLMSPGFPSLTFRNCSKC